MTRRDQPRRRSWPWGARLPAALVVNCEDLYKRACARLRRRSQSKDWARRLKSRGCPIPSCRTPSCRLRLPLTSFHLLRHLLFWRAPHANRCVCTPSLLAKFPHSAARLLRFVLQEEAPPSSGGGSVDATPPAPAPAPPQPRAGLFPTLAADAEMQGKVKGAITHAWSSYKKYAWGMDNLQPLTHNGDNKFLGA